jgi:hypothetical protein
MRIISSLMLPRFQICSPSLMLQGVSPDQVGLHPSLGRGFQHTASRIRNYSTLLAGGVNYKALPPEARAEQRGRVWLPAIMWVGLTMWNGPRQRPMTLFLSRMRYHNLSVKRSIPKSPEAIQFQLWRGQAVKIFSLMIPSTEEAMPTLWWLIVPLVMKNQLYAFLRAEPIRSIAFLSPIRELFDEPSLN